MSSQVTNGKAFEWAVGLAITNTYNFKLTCDNNAKKNKECFQDLGISDRKRTNFISNAEHVIKHIFEKEEITHQSGSIRFLPDSKGKECDVRDIVIQTESKIFGISCKTNHDAFKHPRLSLKNNFVQNWGLSKEGCSKQYFDRIAPIANQPNFCIFLVVKKGL